MLALSFGFVLSTAPELSLDFYVLFVLSSGGLLIGGTVLILEMHRNSCLQTKEEMRMFLISDLPMNSMIYMGVLGNFQPEAREPIVFFMEGVSLFVFIIGLLILRFVFKKKLELK